MRQPHGRRHVDQTIRYSPPRQALSLEGPIAARIKIARGRAKLADSVSQLEGLEARRAARPHERDAYSSALVVSNHDS